MLVLWVLLTTLSLSLCKSGREHPPSPCPSVFSYEGREAETDRWFGVILLSPYQTVTGLRLDIALDRPANVLGNWVGEVQTKNNQRFTIVNESKKVRPAPPMSVKIFVTFPKNSDVPRLSSIKFNGDQICPADAGNASSTQIPSPASPPPEINERVDDKEESLEAAETGDCGLVSVQPSPLVSHGQNTARGQFPWHAALYQTKDLNPVYKCGGSLIGPKTILTAAHCASKVSTVVRPADPETLFVYLGKYYLNQWSEGGVQVKQVVEVILHPDYNSTNYRSDLALLILSSPVQYTKYVRPVCLWDSRKADLSNVVDQQGTVTGWGYDETGKITEDLKMAKMPIVSQAVCLFSDRDFYPQFTSEKTYCAGFLNGTSVCNGDSGGGMVLPNGSSRWAIRGVVSLSKPSSANGHLCNTENYVVFTDVAKYLDWIQTNIQ